MILLAPSWSSPWGCRINQRPGIEPGQTLQLADRQDASQEPACSSHHRPCWVLELRPSCIRAGPHGERCDPLSGPPLASQLLNVPSAHSPQLSARSSPGRPGLKRNPWLKLTLPSCGDPNPMTDQHKLLRGLFLWTQLRTTLKGHSSFRAPCGAGRDLALRLHHS